MKIKLYRTHLALIPAFLLILFHTKTSSGQSTDQNYVMVRAPNREIKTEEKFALLSGNRDSVQTVISYKDGLGRPLQTILKQASPSSKDVVQQNVYDAIGREAKHFLPFVYSGVADGSYKIDALSRQALFYNPAGSSGTQQTNGVVRTSYPFSETGFDSSPLSRAVEQATVGDSWQLPVTGVGNSNSMGHTLKSIYATNDQLVFNAGLLTNNPGYHQVAFFSIDINSDQSRTLTRANNNTAAYETGSLFLSIKRGENWKPGDGCIGTTEDYQDKAGRAILKRIYNLKGATVECISTYFVYDDFGNLCFIIPQLANPDNAGTPISAAFMTQYCYQYRYDELQRPTQSKVPGSGWVYTIYNNLDQPVGNQDSVQRMKSPQEWTFIKYDVLGRPIIAGVFQHIGSNPGIDQRAILQATLTYPYTFYGESRTSAITATGYTNTTWPTSWSSLLSTNYYDDYANIPGFPLPYDKQSNPSFNKNIKGKITVSKIGVLGSTTMLWSVAYYDNKGRSLLTYKQHLLGGTSGYSLYNFDTDSTLYAFDDQVMSNIRKHYSKNSTNNGAVVQLTAIDYLSYDYLGRPVRRQQSLRHLNLAAQPTITLSQLEYNEIGQVRSKKLHSVNGGSSWLQNIDYRYNPRGWPVSINNAGLIADGGVTNSDTNDQFGLELSYENTTTGKPQYNGSISAVKWKAGPVNGTAQPQLRYDYNYDAINRLTAAENRTPAENFYSEYVAYDVMGNIKGLGRYDKVAGVRTKIDTLTYTYTGNQHTRIDDGAGTSGFNDAAKVANEYTYDGNGNAVKDLNKGISSIIYNALNLPQNITISAGTVAYTYDAAGRKLRKVLTTSTNTYSTDYIDGIQYTDGAIEFIQTGEGRARKSGTAYIYEYDLKDHLGNTRVTIKPDAVNATLAVMLQQNNYYGFGSAITSLNYTVMPKNQYLYNGKELQEETGVYDYDARFYDPLIGRWNVIDPLADNYAGTSPYNYAFDNPLSYVDPTGMGPEDWYLPASAHGDLTQAEWFAGNGAKSGYTHINAPQGFAINPTTGQTVNFGADGTKSEYTPQYAQGITITATRIGPSAGAKALDIATDFIPIVGPSKDIYKGVRDGNYWQASMGAAFLVFDLATLGEASAAKGVITAAIKESTEIVAREGAEIAIRQTEKSIVIGEGMSRVKTAAKSLDAKWYQAWSKNFPNRAMTEIEMSAAKARNARWLKSKIKQGYKVYDIGIDATRTARSPFYQIEKEIVQKMGTSVIAL
ncbi:RHS repeat-associated protein [Mucilaginibacter sp. UYNi724]